MEKRTRITIFKNKLMFKIFFCELDIELILDKAEEILNQMEPEWRSEQDNFSLKVIPPELENKI